MGNALRSKLGRPLSSVSKTVKINHTVYTERPRENFGDIDFQQRPPTSTTKTNTNTNTYNQTQKTQAQNEGFSVKRNFIPDVEDLKDPEFLNAIKSMGGSVREQTSTEKASIQFGKQNNPSGKMRVADYLKQKQTRNQGLTREEWIEIFALYHGNTKKFKLNEQTPVGGWNVENLAQRYRIDSVSLGHVFKYFNVPTIVFRNGRNEGHWTVIDENNKPDLKKYILR